MKLQFTPSQSAEIAQAIAKRPALDYLRKYLRDSQITLRAWRSSPPRHRGYLSKPDCAGELILQCRAIRHVLLAIQ